MSNEPLKVAIAGLGTVGAGTVKVLTQHADLISARAGRAIVVTAVSARNKNRDRGVDLSGMTWFDDPVEMARSADADVIVELIGGADGVAKAMTEAAFAAGRPVVTANKALVAENGHALALAAEQAGVTLAYEAAVAGGIPIIKSLREGLAGNHIAGLHGILNGTCNYILSTMRDTGADFDDVLKEAQELGYAEADPSFDVGGIDAAHKLAILAALAFGTQVDFESVHVEGITSVTAEDITFAEALGFRLKLLGIARQDGDRIEQRVYPCLIDEDEQLAAVEGVFNAVFVDGDAVGRAISIGRGAGEGPTASAVVADIIDIAAGRHAPVFGILASALTQPEVVPVQERVGSYYIRLQVADKPGVVADIGAALRDQGVSIESLIQHGHPKADTVHVVMTVHDTVEASLMKALETLGANPALIAPAQVLRIEKFSA